MAFRTVFDRIEVNSNSGDRFNITYNFKYDENGLETLTESGKIDVYEKIQSFKDSCDLQVLLMRYANGDTSALNARPIFYGDISDAPKSLSEHYQLLHDAEVAFDRLPADVRANFDYDVVKFYSSIGSDQFYKSLGIDVKADPIKAEKEGEKSE